MGEKSRDMTKVTLRLHTGWVGGGFIMGEPEGETGLVGEDHRVSLGVVTLPIMKTLRKIGARSGGGQPKHGGTRDRQLCVC